MTVEPVAHVQIRWIPPEQGGRSRAVAPPTYAATAHFADEPLSELFSVVLVLRASTGAAASEASLRLLAADRLPEKIRKLTPGARLVITEGPRPIAEATVASVSSEPWHRPLSALPT